MIIVNFKIYPQTFGDGAIKLAEICHRVEEETNVAVYMAVSALDAVRIQAEFGPRVLLQHLDPVTEGRGNGKLSPLQAVGLGIKGSLLNHSEDKQPPGTIKRILKTVPANFLTIVCVRSVKQAEIWSKKKVAYIAYEPSELIASQDKSVATEKPAAIKTMVATAKGIPVLVGAGVKTRADVETALGLGAKGILVATSVVTNQNPYEQLKDLATGFAIIR